MHHPQAKDNVTNEPARENERVESAWQPCRFEEAGCPYAPLTIFRDEAAAREHVGKHVLGPEEADAWALVVPLMLEVADIASPSQRSRLYQYVRGGKREVFEALYELYAKSIVLNLEDACLLGWKNVEERGRRGWVGVALGTSGLLIVAENGVIKTAFLAGQADPEDGNSSSRSAVSSLSNRHRMRRGYRPRVPPPREARWSDAERLYYRVFRPALRFARRCVYEYAPGVSGLRSRRSDYWLLKDVLPTIRSVRYERWAAWREKCRGRLYAEDVN